VTGCTTQNQQGNATMRHSNVETTGLTSTQSRTSAMLKTNAFIRVLPGSIGCTLIKKNRVPNLVLPFATARSKYNPKIATEIVPNSGNHWSNQVKYTFRNPYSCTEASSVKGSTKADARERKHTYRWGEQHVDDDMDDPANCQHNANDAKHQLGIRPQRVVVL
jgi:hypothetical protein